MSAQFCQLPEEEGFFLVGETLNQCSVQDVNRGWGWQRKGRTGRKSGRALYRERFGENSGKTLKQLQAEMQGSGEPSLKVTANVLASTLCLCVCMLSHSVVSNSLQPHGLLPARLLCPWNFPGKLLEPVAVSYSRGSSQPRDQTQISCISYTGRQTLNHCTTGKPHKYFLKNKK